MSFEGFPEMPRAARIAGQARSKLRWARGLEGYDDGTASFICSDFVISVLGLK